MYKEAPLLNGGEAFMFTQFRVRYPKGSLLTELSAIDHGKYIVRCLVQDEGTTLVTSLAAAETVELAEDKARGRALAILGISSTTATGEQETPLTVSEVSVPLPSTPKVSPAFSSEILGHNSPAQLSDPTTGGIPPLENGNDWGTRKQEDLGNFEEIPAVPHFPLEASNDVPQPQDAPSAVTENTSSLPLPTPKREKAGKRSAKTQKVADEITFSASDEFSSAEVETSSREEVETPLWMAENASVLPTEDVPVPSSAQTQSETDNDRTATIVAPIDFSEIIARTNVELKRLGWTNQQGRDYLVQTYGKRSRQLLTDDELLDFLHHLESEPTPEK